MPFPIRVFAELDCLLSLAKASADLDEPRCRPTIVDSEQAFLDFQQLRHPAMCLRSDFISNDVQLGGKVPRQALLTGPSEPKACRGMHRPSLSISALQIRRVNPPCVGAYRSDMSGKYLLICLAVFRMTAVAVIMAQLGAMVPAASAT